MKPYKIISGICALALLATLGVGAVFATNDDGTTDTTSPGICDRMEKRERICLTDEQKEKMEEIRANMEASQEKWAALTDEQKEEIYALRENAADIDGQIIDKYLEWGLINEETADQMKERISEGIANMRENDRFPMLAGRGEHIKGKFRGAFQNEGTNEGTTDNTN